MIIKQVSNEHQQSDISNCLDNRFFLFCYDLFAYLNEKGDFANDVASAKYVYFVQYIKSTRFFEKKLLKNRPILTVQKMYHIIPIWCTHLKSSCNSQYISFATYSIWPKFRHFVDFFVLLQIFGAFSLRGHSEWNRGFHRRRRFFVNGYQERRTRPESKWGSRPRLVFQKLTVPVRPFCFGLTCPQEASLKNEQWRHLLVMTHFFGQKLQIVDKNV